jgi:hypothetical protein
MTIARTWDAHGLQPHRVRTFKLSHDKRFVEKLNDVVGLYLGGGGSPAVCRQPLRGSTFGCFSDFLILTS